MSWTIKEVSQVLDECIVSIMKGKIFILLTLAASVALLCPPLTSAAPILGSAQDFSVLGASTVTNTGPSTIYGSLGVDPTNSITGFPPGIVTGGSIYEPGGVSNLAQSAALAAYTTLSGLSSAIITCARPT